MRNIALARIDERLIHGQVYMYWTKVCKSNTAVIIDDPVAKDSFLSNFIKKAAPKGMKCLIFNSEDAVKYLLEDPEPGEIIITLAKSPLYYEKLIEGGIPFEKIIIGNMAFRGKRKYLTKNAYVDEEEKECLKRMIAKGIDVTYQTIPIDPEFKIKDYIDKVKFD